MQANRGPVSFLKAYPGGKQPRFDVCEVFLDDKFKLKKINYIENAFTESV